MVSDRAAICSRDPALARKYMFIYNKRTTTPSSAIAVISALAVVVNV